MVVTRRIGASSSSNAFCMIRSEIPAPRPQYGQSSSTITARWVFTTEAITLLDANQRLKQAGFHGVMRLDEVRKVDKIPTLGSGKVDYTVLRAQIAKETPEPVPT